MYDPEPFALICATCLMQDFHPADTFSFIWSLSSIAKARRKQALPTSGNISSSLCTTCHNANLDIWPYPAAEQVALPSLQQVLTRHQEPAVQDTQSQISLSAFLKPVHKHCKRSKAGKGSHTIKKDQIVELPPSPDMSTIQVDVETARIIEARTPGQLSRAPSEVSSIP